ncbi:MAG: hypothetical protein NVSMB24_38250 [Mucilaginibacter sp.]
MRKKILFIENDKDTQEVVALLLSGENIEVIGSYDSAIAADIHRIRPDLILLDEWLGDMLGSEICARLKDDTSTVHIPVVLISAITGLDRIAAQCKVDAYIEKPFEIEHLKQVVRRFL